MARIFLDEMGGVNQGGILASYGLPISPFSTEEYAPTIVETPSRPTRARRKQSKPKPKRNDGIIRNHDSVWDYKIQNGKLLTRRKTSDGKWYDITSNDEARTRIEQFTGRSIGNKQTASSNSFQSSKPTSTTKPSNNSQSQSSKPVNTVQTQQTTRPATAQPTRQQVVRQDSTRQQTTQPRNLATTRGSNTEPDWQNMTDSEVQAYFANSPLGGVTKTGRGNPNKKKELLSAEDLAANGWHWSNGQASFGDKDTDNFNLLNSARDKVEAGDNILLDANGAVVPTSEVRRYINRGRIPLYISDYDAQFYQPQAYSKPHEVRMAERRRWNYNYDKQQNAALATMFGLPALAGAVATAPIATVAALGGGELLNAGVKALGFDWDKWVGGKYDANAELYGPMVNPFRAAGNIAGGIGGNALQPKVSEVVNPYVNRFSNYLTNKFTNIGVNRNVAYPTLAATEETEASIALARAMQESLNPKGTPRQLARAMNKSLKNKGIVQRERQMLAEDVPYLFDPEMTSSNYYYPLNPAMGDVRMGPYGIPNHVNGVPFGTPVPRVLGAVPESNTTFALPIRPTNSLQPMPDAFAQYGVPYRQPVRVVQAEEPRVIVRSSAKKQYPKQKGKRKKK